jgi:hypothetical protein
MGTEARILTETKFLTVVDTYAGYCQVCRDPRKVGRIAVAGWQYHGTICSNCLRGLADEVERRGKGLAVETADKGDPLASIVGGNGYVREPVMR